MSEELSVLQNIDAKEVFTGDLLPGLLEGITKEATAFVPDLTTAKGRKEIASMAAKVAKSKTYLDGAGKDMVSGWKAQAKKVDDKRKHLRDYLDNLKVEVRKPLTEWEEAEEKRVESFKSTIEEMAELGELTVDNWMEARLKIMIANREALEITDVSEEIWQEFAQEARDTRDKAISQINKAIEKRERYDADQAELTRLKGEAAAREQAEHEERYRKEGEERARKESEHKAKEAKETAEREAKQAMDRENAAKQAQKDAEARAEQAEQDAQLKANRAAQEERDRIKAAQEAEEQAARDREADKAHKAKINNAAAGGLIGVGLSEDQAKLAVKAIAKGKIPNVKISY